MQRTGSAPPPRPNLVIEDYASAVGHLMARDEVDPVRVAIVGVS
jgi:hypothetical protein